MNKFSKHNWWSPSKDFSYTPPKPALVDMELLSSLTKSKYSQMENVIKSVKHFVKRDRNNYLEPITEFEMKLLYDAGISHFGGRLKPSAVNFNHVWSSAITFTSALGNRPPELTYKGWKIIDAYAKKKELDKLTM